MRKNGLTIKVLLYHSELCWISWGKMVNRVFQLRGKLFTFLENQNHWHLKLFMGPSFLLTLGYLADIFSTLSPLNCQMQGGGVNIIEAEKKMSAFRKNLWLWWQQLENDKFTNFLLLDKLLCNSNVAINDQESGNKLQRLKPVIIEHLQEFEQSFKSYFPKQGKYSAWIWQLFTFDTATADTSMALLSFKKATLKNTPAPQVLTHFDATMKWKGILVSLKLPSIFLCLS